MENQHSYWVLGHKITPLQVSGSFDMVIGETPEQVPGPPPHHHSRMSEMFLVLEGVMEFTVEGETVRLEKGRHIDLAPGRVHTFRNAGNGTCKWLNVHSPKGFLSFFETMGVSARDEGAQHKSTDEAIIRRVLRHAAEYDMLIEA